jgi:hypothetical protein
VGKTARPTGSSKYSPEIVDHICAEIVVGKSMREICRASDMPDMRTVFRRLAAHSEFQQVYARARQAQPGYLAEEIFEIADDGKNDQIERQDGSAAVNNEAIQRSRLRVDARKWLMSKAGPEKYGEKREITGQIHHVVEQLTEDERRERALDTLTKARPKLPKVANDG